MDLHLITVQVKPSAYVKDTIDGTITSLKTGVASAQGRIIYCFKIVGENRLIAVLDGGVESAITSLNAAYGDQTEVTCCPLRTYEGFASHVLGLTAPLTTRPAMKFLPEGQGRLYWLHFTVGYKGKTTAQLITTWSHEAKTVLTLREKGELQLDLFKAAGPKEIHMFISVPNSEILDDIIFTLPIMKDLGDQVTITCKSIVNLV